MENNCETHTGKSGPQHGVPKLVVVAFHPVDKWFDLLGHVATARHLAEFLKRLFNANRFDVSAGRHKFADVFLVLLSLDLERCQRT